MFVYKLASRIAFSQKWVLLTRKWRTILPIMGHLNPKWTNCNLFILNENYNCLLVKLIDFNYVKGGSGI